MNYMDIQFIPRVSVVEGREYRALVGVVSASVEMPVFKSRTMYETNTFMWLINIII